MELLESLYDIMDEDELEQSSAIDNIDKLLGCQGYKKYIDELEKMSANLFKLSSCENYPSEHLLWAIDKGHGCSTILKSFRDYISSKKIYALSNREDIVFKELHFILSKSLFADMDNVFENLINELNYDKCGVIGIHIESFLNDLDNKYFVELLKYCANKRHNNIFVFIIPYVDEGVLTRVNRYISYYLNIKLIKFLPYTDYDLIEKVKENLLDFNIEFDSSCEKCFRKLLNRERSDGRFYGMQTVNKLSTELVLLKLKNYSQKNTLNVDKLEESDFKEYFQDNDDEKNSGIEQLNKLVGLTDVKKRIEEIVASINVHKSMYEKGLEESKPCYHMMFTGNPGTGKTALARIVGRIFYDNGLLPIGDLIEVSRVDLVAEHIGQTGPKTVSVCNLAMGSVLFIDEAYMLAAGSGDRSGKDFGVEALGALIAEMENKRDKFIVIMAGYEDDINELFKINPGLKQRIPHRIHFENYNNQELFDIFMVQLDKNCTYNEDFIKTSKQYFYDLSEEILKSNDFANARFVRNLVDRVRIKSLLRQTFDTEATAVKIELKAIDFENAIADEDIKSLSKKNKLSNIGFKK